VGFLAVLTGMLELGLLPLFMLYLESLLGLDAEFPNTTEIVGEAVAVFALFCGELDEVLCPRFAFPAGPFFHLLYCFVLMSVTSVY